MTLDALALAALILVTPGPTNALLATAGATEGSRAFRLVPAIVLAYLVSVGVLLALKAFLLGPLAPVLMVLRAGLALFLLWLAFRLWRVGGQSAARRSIDAKSIFMATLLNPKGPLIALEVVPPPAGIADLAASLSLIAAEVAVVSAGWAAAGLPLTRIADRFPSLVPRISAAVLVAFAILLAASLVR